VDAYTAEKSWREGIRAGLAALLRFFDEQPLIAELCVVHAAGAGTSPPRGRCGLFSPSLPTEQQRRQPQLIPDG
jgi:hypothetical protein